MTPHEAEQAVEFCIWHAQPDRIAALPRANPQSWGGSVQGQMLAFGRNPDLTSRLQPHAAHLEFAAILMIKDEADIIGSNLIWLYHLGIRRFAIIDNNSSDGTQNVISAFFAARPDATLILEHDPIVAHFQAEKTSALCHLARQAWPDLEWLIPVDADEFLQARSGLQSLLFVPDEIEALTIPKVIHFQPQAATQGSLFQRMHIRSLPFAVPPKVILRAGAALSVAKGNHWVNSTEGRPARYDGGLTYGLFHREFQTRSFAQFSSKVRNGGAAVLAANALGHEVGGQHWLEWHALWKKGGEPALRAEYERVAFREAGVDYVMDLFDSLTAP